MMTQVWRSHPTTRLPLLASLFSFTLPLCIIGSLAPITTAVAQEVTPDGTVSTTVITPDGKNFTINDGTTRGGNLFHSFKEFSVPTGGSASFNNAANIQNIISRVTGGSISTIDGLIRTLGTANLFLLNPAGIIFGPNARLNIGGSFLGSTANSFLFDNGFEFSATNPQAPPLLTINIPIGLRYWDNPGNIQVQGPATGSGLVYEAKEGRRDQFDSTVTGLQVEPGKTLALVGGNVSVERGILRSEGGRVEIGSFDSNQVVKIVPQEQGLSLGYEGTPSFRDIQFSEKSFVNVTGDGGGSIAIIGRNINFNSESLLLSDTLGDKNGGEIRIVGDSIVFNQSSALSNTFSLGNGAQVKLDANNIKFENQSAVSIQTHNRGKAGDINIGANSLEMGGGSAFVSWAIPESTGNSGNININVKSPLVIANTGIVADSSGTGNAGKINMNANSLRIDTSHVSSKVVNTGQAGEINLTSADFLGIKGSDITTDTSGRGDAGKINIKANSFQLEEGIVSSQAKKDSTGNAGEINIAVTGSLELPQNAGISTTTAGIGDAGKININANSFLLEGSNVFSNSEKSSTGNAGKININANSLRIESSSISSKVENTGQGGEINFNIANSLGIKFSSITTDTSGTGDAGKININANSFRLEGVGLSSQALENSIGQGGEINITVGGSLELPKGVGILTSTFGTGNAGNISITTDTLSVANGSNITANTSGKGNAGNIIINAREVSFAKINVGNDGNTYRSGVFSTVKDTGMGNGGEIRITTDKLSLTDGAQLSAKSDGQGNAGDIKINARSLSITNGAQLSVNSANKNYTAGNITVTTTKDIQLDNQASINANTKGGQGNISLSSRDLILRRNSNITTNATGTVDGGNIKITTDNFVALEDSNITANAEKGYGGEVNITAQGIFRSPDSDITASSEAGSQFNGIVQFNTPDTDPTRGLFELSETVIDPAQQITQNPCIKGFGSTFTIVGRGGFPTDPKKILSSDNVRVDLVKPVTSTPEKSTTVTHNQPSTSPPVKRIIPAQGWIFNEKGEVLLVAYDPTKTGPQRQQPTPASTCAAR